MNRILTLLNIILSLSLILGTHNGYLALWTEGSPLPIEVYPYKIINLPPQEAEKLESGIAIRDGSQLRALLQDYLS